MDSEERFEITPEGYAVARQGQHQVILAPNLNALNAVDLQMPDGQRLISRPLGLAFCDTASGSNVLIATLKDCAGQWLAPNVVLYPDAFEGLKAAVRYTYTRAGFEQDVVLYENPGSPAAYGLNPATTQLEIWTEFFTAPTPRVTAVPTRNGSTDERVEFGAMALGQGQAYFLSLANHDKLSLPVRKSWQQIGERTFLVEAVPYATSQPLLDRLVAVPQGQNSRLAQKVVKGREALVAAFTPQVSLPLYVRNFLAGSNEIFFRADGTNGTFSGTITDTNCPTTLNYQPNDVGIFVRAGWHYNINVMDCTYNGDVTLTNFAWVDAGDGIIWCQGGGNWFAARNAITNYALEAIQWNSGPAAAVQNTFSTFVSTPATCALNNPLWSYEGPTGQGADASFSFVANTVIGGRHGVLGASWNAQNQTSIAWLLVGGNSLDLTPAFPRSDDGPGATANLWWADKLNLTGNTIVQGEGGLIVGCSITNAVILKNDFGAASMRSIDDQSNGGELVSCAIVKNKLSAGVSFHVRAPIADGAQYFLLQNSYRNSAGATVNLFPEPLALPVHFNP